tara:strand:+ start:19 stop:987 length:969 start_codon:yes stop_codon:yes gene_type:complete
MKEIYLINSNFTLILELRQEIQNILNNLSSKLKILREIYLNLTKTHNCEKDSIGIDSFYFQNTMFEIEFQNMNQMFLTIDNRLYCEHYKLYKLIQLFINNEIKDSELMKKINCNKKFPAYKNLDITKKYDIKITTDLQNLISKIITELHNYMISRDEEIKNDCKQSDMGLNIDNLINTQIFNNILLKEKINMFIRYLKAFFIHHEKYYKRLILKLKLVVGVINEDIILSNNNNNISDIKLTPEESASPNTQINSDEEESIRRLIDPGTNVKDALDSALSSINTNVSDSDENIIIDEFNNQTDIILSEISQEVREKNLKKIET